MSTPYGPQDPTPTPEQAEPPKVVVPTDQEPPGSATTDESAPAVLPALGARPEPDDHEAHEHGARRSSAAASPALLVIAAVVNQFWGFRFPGNAPVEQIFVFGITVDLVAMAVVLGIFAILAASRRSVPVKPQSISPMAIAAIILSGVVDGLLAAVQPRPGAHERRVRRAPTST